MLKSIHAFFNHSLPRKIFLKLRLAILLTIAVAVAYFAEARWFLPAVLISLFGQLIQSWSFASLVKNVELTVRGPYVLVRNPMYLGRYFLLLGLILLPGNLLIVLGYTVFYYFYMVNRVQREETRLRKELGEPYEQYCRLVHRFLPSFLRIEKREVWFFNWRVLLNNNGHWNFLATVIVYLLLYGYIFHLR